MPEPEKTDRTERVSPYAMETRAMAYFREIARVGTFAGAAANLYVASSAIARQIDLLEASVGTRLLDRGRHGVTLTPAGEILRDYAERAVAAIEATRSMLPHADTELRGRVRIATIEAAGTMVLTQVGAALADRSPHASLLVDVVGSHEVSSRVAEGDADLGVAFGPPSRSDVAVSAQFPSPLGVVMREDHALAGRDGVSVRELSGARVALPESNFGIRQEIERSTHEAGVALNTVLESNSLSFLLETVSARNDVVTFMPEMMVTPQRPKLVFVPLKGRRLNSTRISIISGLAVRSPLVDFTLGALHDAMRTATRSS